MKGLAILAMIILSIMAFDISYWFFYEPKDIHQTLSFYHVFDRIPDFKLWVYGTGFICFALLKEKFVWEGIAFLFLNRNNPTPDAIETEEELAAQGYTRAQIKRELRAQKAAHRSHDWLRNSNIRTVRTLRLLKK